MGRDFSINHVESTYKPISFIMHTMIKDVCDFENECEDGIIHIQDLAKIITSLKFIIETVTSEHAQEDNIKFFMEKLSFYESDNFNEILENCKRAYNLFVDCLVESTLGGDKELRWSYS